MDEGDRCHVPPDAANELPEICRLDKFTAEIVSKGWHPPDAAAEGRQRRDQLLRPVESREEKAMQVRYDKLAISESVEAVAAM